MSPKSIDTPESAELPQLVRLVQDCTAAMGAAAIDQWDEVYPDEKTLRDDIASETLFVCRAETRIIGCVVLNDFQDPEYAEVPWPRRHGAAAQRHLPLLRKAPRKAVSKVTTTVPGSSIISTPSAQTVALPRSCGEARATINSSAFRGVILGSG